MKETNVQLLYRGVSRTGKHHWFPTDTMEKWEKNMASPVIRESMIHNGWDKIDSILYNVNIDGFRDSTSDSFLRYQGHNDKFGIALGCSCTFGIGLKTEQTWVHKLSQLLGISILNFGIPGGAPDTSFRLASYWIEKLRPSFVIYVEPPPGRFEMIEYHGNCTNCHLGNPAKYDAFFKDWLVNEYNWKLDYKKNQMAMELLCIKYDIKFYHYSVNSDLDCLGRGRFRINEPYDLRERLARDQSHPGPKANELFAQRLAQEIS